MSPRRIIAMAKPPAVIIAAAMLVAAYEWALFVSTIFAPGSIGPDYHGIGTDWMVFHGAAQLARAGDFARLYDGTSFTAYLNARFAPYLFTALSYRPWVNPPWFLLAMLPFAWLSFPLSFAAGQLLQAGWWGHTIRKALPDNGQSRTPRLIAIGLLSPAMAANALCGQTGLLASALIIQAIHAAQKHPRRAGIALAMLSFKPQFCPVIVIFLLARGRIAALAWAALAGAVLITASLLAFGVQPWINWFDTLRHGLSGTGAWNEYGRLWGNSLYACLAAMGIPTKAASLAQSFVGVSCLGIAWLIGRKDAYPHRQTAGILILTLIAAPHFGLYDTIIALSALIVAFTGNPALAPRRVAAWAIPLLVWLIPFYSPPAINPMGILTPLILAGALGQLYLRQGGNGTGVPESGQEASGDARHTIIQRQMTDFAQDPKAS